MSGLFWPVNLLGKKTNSISYTTNPEDWNINDKEFFSKLNYLKMEKPLFLLEILPKIKDYYILKILHNQEIIYLGLLNPEKQVIYV